MMNEAAGKGQMKVRVYIYTAINGYSWQVRDDSLAESLRVCLGSSWKNAASNGCPAIGGIRRGEIGGLNGTAVYRVHVRRNGDFAGRDSDYVALAFIPFAQIGERFVDYAKLWSHKFLSAPLEKNDELSRLEIDLEKEGVLSAIATTDSKGADDYWTADGAPMDGVSGTIDDVLARLSTAFQFRKSELGSFSVSIFGDNRGRLFVQSRYKPFSSVKEENEARRQFEALRRIGGEEAAKAAAYKRWGETVNALVALTDSRNGQFRHFLGLCQYAREESGAYAAGAENGELRSIVARGVDNAKKILDAASPRLSGDEFDHSGIGVALEENVRWLRALVDQLPGNGDLRNRVNGLGKGIDAMRQESELVRRWLRQADNSPAPSHVSPTLSSMSDKLAKANKVRGESGAASPTSSPSGVPYRGGRRKSPTKWLLPMAVGSVATMAAVMALLLLLKAAGFSLTKERRPPDRNQSVGKVEKASPQIKDENKAVSPEGKDEHGDARH